MCCRATAWLQLKGTFPSEICSASQKTGFKANALTHNVNSPPEDLTWMCHWTKNKTVAWIHVNTAQFGSTDRSLIKVNREMKKSVRDEALVHFSRASLSGASNQVKFEWIWSKMWIAHELLWACCSPWPSPAVSTISRSGSVQAAVRGVKTKSHLGSYQQVS